MPTIDVANDFEFREGSIDADAAKLIVLVQDGPLTEDEEDVLDARAAAGGGVVPYAEFRRTLGLQ